MVYLHQEQVYNFFFLSICTDELLPTTKLVGFLSQSKFENEKSKQNLKQLL